MNQCRQHTVVSLVEKELDYVFIDAVTQHDDEDDDDDGDDAYDGFIKERKTMAVSFDFISDKQQNKKAKQSNTTVARVE